MSRKLTKAEKRLSVQQILAGHDLDPIDRLAREGIAEIRLSDTEAAHPSVSALLSDHELIPDSGGKGWILRPNLARRIECWKELAKYCHPQLRSTECKISEDRNFTFIVQTFDHLKGKDVYLSQEEYARRQVPTDREPKQLPPTDREPVELHDGDKVNQS